MIEIIVALSLAVMLCVLIFSAYALVTAVHRSQAGRQAPEDAARGALRRLAGDLERTFVAADDPQAKFLLLTGAAASNALWELSFCRGATAPGEPEERWANLERVTYRLLEQADAGALLLCASQPLAGPGAWQPPRTNEIIRHLAQLEIRLFDGQTWHDQWPPAGAGQTSSVPRAARLDITALVAGIRAMANAKVLIPAGNRIESRTQQAETKKKEATRFH
ncbi:MAG: hypothetical protein NTV49_10655 [Kiritimatiellaeota bacterium]|nr:hypothetical protein [Kiritimatiellota bacterium]